MNAARVRAEIAAEDAFEAAARPQPPVCEDKYPPLQQQRQDPAWLIALQREQQQQQLSQKL